MLITITFLKLISYKNFNFKCIPEGKGELPPVIENDPSGIPGNRRVEVIFRNRGLSNDTILANRIAHSHVADNLILKDLNFLPGQHYLREESFPVFKTLMEALKQHPGLKIEIRGHVCCTDSTKDGYDLDLENFHLSVNRAKYIYDWLITHGIDSSRLTYKGLARKYPLIPVELTEIDRMKNRRVEIRILQK